MPLNRQQDFTPSPRVRATCVALIAALMVAGCADKDKSRALGGVVGMVAGAAVGSLFGKGKGRVAMMTIGAAIGGIYGPDIFANLTSEDKNMASDTIDDTLQTADPGETKSWNNPKSGNGGTVQASETYAAGDNGDCRDFETTVFTQDGEQTATGTACRGEDGIWSVVKEPAA